MTPSLAIVPAVGTPTLRSSLTTPAISPLPSPSSTNSFAYVNKGDQAASRALYQGHRHGCALLSPSLVSIPFCPTTGPVEADTILTWRPHRQRTPATLQAVTWELATNRPRRSPLPVLPFQYHNQN